METAVITFFSGMLKSFMGTQNPREWSLTITAPNGQLIKCPKGTLFFYFVTNYLMGISLNTSRRWNIIFEEVTFIRDDYSFRYQLGFPLIPDTTFTGGTNSGHLDFSDYGQEFIVLVMLVYANRLNGIDIFTDIPQTFPELDSMKADIELNCQRFLNAGLNYGYDNGYTRERTGFGGGISIDYFRSWIDYGLTIIEQDNQFNELLTMALNDDGIIYGTGTAGLTFNEQGTTYTTPPLDGVGLTVDTNNSLVATTNTLNSSNLSKMGLGALILILFLTFKK